MNSLRTILLKARIKGTFLRNLMYTFSSNAIVYAFNLAFYPVLTQIYGPDAYAEYAIWTLVFNNLMVFSTFGYSDSLVVVTHQKDYFKLGSGITYLSVVVTLISLPLYLFFVDTFWNYFEINGFWWMTLVFPVVILATMQQEILGMGTVRFGLLERSAKVSSYLRIGSKMLVLFVGWMGLNQGIGLLIGDIIFFVLALLMILPTNKTWLFFRELWRFDLRGSLNLLRLHADYPKFVFPTLWVVVLIQQVPLWSIGFKFSISDLGLYTFCWGLLGVPVGIAMKSIRPVFFHKNMELKQISLKERKQKIMHFVNIQFAGLILFLMVGYWGTEWCYDFIFAEKWSEGKSLIQNMLVGSGGIILAGPMSSIFKVNGKMKIDLAVRLVILVSLIALSSYMVTLNINLFEFAYYYNFCFFGTFVILFLFQLREFGFKFQEFAITLLKLLASIVLYLLITIPFYG